MCGVQNNVAQLWPACCTTVSRAWNLTHKTDQINQSHNTPFRTKMCTFLLWMVHCGIQFRRTSEFVGLLCWSKPLLWLVNRIWIVNESISLHPWQGAMFCGFKWPLAIAINQQCYLLRNYGGIEEPPHILRPYPPLPSHTDDLISRPYEIISKWCHAEEIVCHL